MKTSNKLYNLIALFTVFVWGTTFISTKFLLIIFTPIEIMFLRFIIAYIILWLFYPKYHKIYSIKDELFLALAGLTGGTLYFVTENTALTLTLTSNVGLILATAPILTAVIAHQYTAEEKIHKNLIIGFIVAILGVFLVMFNGNFILKLNPLGDILALTAAFCWGIYSVAIKKIGSKYNYIYITRKVFFYALVTMIPFIVFSDFRITINDLFSTVSIFNLLFLGVVASGICFITWNLCVSKLGAIKANNYIYFMPIITLFFSAVVLNEQITIFSLLGTILILLGVYLSEK